MTQDRLKLAQSIDHTLLKGESTEADYAKLCEEAKSHNFFSVCVPPYFVSSCKENLRSSCVKVCTVIGFPFGYSFASVKSREANLALAAGADELDLVMNYAALKSGRPDVVEYEIKKLRRLGDHFTLKVILETCFLNDHQIVEACKLSEGAGANFVKTSTGFGSGGATEHHVKLMRNSVSANVQVKASGGIRDYQTAMQMLNAGATRLGTSASVAILNGQMGTGNY